MKQIRIVISIFLLALSMQLVIPRELFHGLCDHHDTEDCNIEDGSFHLSKQHEHCSIFELSTPPVLNESEYLLEFAKVSFPLIFINETRLLITNFINSFESRGPPVI